MHFDLKVISDALQVLLEATLPVLVGMSTLWLRAKYDTMRNGLNNEKRFLLDSTIRIGVFAAEQLSVTGEVKDKLDYVTSLAQAQADKLGLSLSAEELRAMIEAAVKQNFPKFPEPGVPVRNF